MPTTTDPLASLQQLIAAGTPSTMSALISAADEFENIAIAFSAPNYSDDVTREAGILQSIASTVAAEATSATTAAAVAQLGQDTLGMYTRATALLPIVLANYLVADASGQGCGSLRAGQIAAFQTAYNVAQAPSGGTPLTVNDTWDAATDAALRDVLSSVNTFPNCVTGPSSSGGSSGGSAASGGSTSSGGSPSSSGSSNSSNGSNVALIMLAGVAVLGFGALVMTAHKDTSGASSATSLRRLRAGTKR